MNTRQKKIKKSFHFTAKGIFTAIACIALAVVIWLIVMWIDAPEYNKDFEIEGITVIGEDAIAQYELACDTESLSAPYEVAVQGSKIALYDLLHGESRITATVDVSSFAQPGEYHLKIDYRLPDGIKLIDPPEYVVVKLTK